MVLLTGGIACFSFNNAIHYCGCCIHQQLTYQDTYDNSYCYCYCYSGNQAKLCDSLLVTASFYGRFY